MPLIDSSYFVDDIALPNLDNVANSFLDTINIYEAEILERLLGHQLYNDFITGLGEPIIEQKWTDLLEGVGFTFELDSQTIVTEWKGLINEEKKSLISYYVYCIYRDINISTTTSINDVQGTPENATKVNDSRKIMNAFNKGVDLYGEIPLYTLFDKYSTSYDYYTDLPSAYNFLNANRVDYTNWVFTPLEKINNMGL